MQTQHTVSSQAGLPAMGHQSLFRLRDDCSPIDKVLNFEFPALVTRLQQELDLSAEEANQLFRDMLQYLYLCGAKAERVPLEPTAIIDKAWHTFIIFTKEYAAFCQDHFGRFIHHAPYTGDESEHDKQSAIPAADVAETIFGHISPNWHAAKGDCQSTCRGGCNGQSCRDND